MQYKIVKDYKFKRLQRNNSMPEMFKDPIILKKEKEWDSRFIYNKIPEYDSFTDKNVLNKGIFNSNIKNTSLANVNKKKNNENNNLSPKGSHTHRNFFKKPNLTIENNLYAKNEKENTYVSNIKFLWEELSVLSTYKELFSVVCDQLDEQSREDFFKKEIENLNSIKQKVNSLSSTIKNRNNYISQLKLLNNDFSEEMKNSEKNDELINKTLENIQNLRKLTIELVNKMINLRKEINYSCLGGKFDIDLLGLKNGFDKYFLIKMKDELLFLKDGYLKFFINVNNDNSPFLLKASDEINNNNFNIKVPITEEVREEIKKCQYIIFQDLIFYQSQNLDKDNLKSNISKFINNSPMYKTYNKPFLKIKKTQIECKKDFNFIKRDNNSVKSERGRLSMSNSFIASLKLNPIKSKLKIKKLSQDISKAIDNLSGNNYKITFYKKTLNSFNEKHYKSYFKRIPNELINFFHLNQNIFNSFLVGISPCLLLLKDNNRNIIGLSGISYHIFDKNLTLNINHISSIDKKNFKNNIQILINYIQNKFQYDDIKINFYNDSDELKNFLIEENKFEIEGNNTLKFIKSKKVINKVKKPLLNQIFLISNSIMISNNNQNGIYDNENNNIDKYINIVTYNYLISDNNPNNIISDFYFKIENLNDFIKYLSKNNLNIKQIPNIDNPDNIKSCILNDSIFQNVNIFNSNNISCLIENTGFYYNFIKPPFNIYNNKKKNCIIYQITLNNISFIICEITKELKEYLDMNNIYIQMNEIYKESLNDNEIIQKDDCIIWIPCFEKVEYLKTDKISFSNTNNNSTVNEHIKLENKKINKSLKKDFDKIPYLQIEPDKNNDIIINNNFLFGIINQKILNQTEINSPYIIFLTEISTKDFITS